MQYLSHIFKLMKAKKYILLFLFIAFCFTDCKKYPEGPAFSLWSKTWRLSGSWEVEAFLIDGIDSTSQLTCVSCGIHKDEHYYMSGPCISSGNSSSTWHFENHSNNLLLSVDFPNSSDKTPFPKTGPLSSYISWEIQRLTRKQLWLMFQQSLSERTLLDLELPAPAKPLNLSCSC